MNKSIEFKSGDRGAQLVLYDQSCVQETFVPQQAMHIPSVVQCETVLPMVREFSDTLYLEQF